MPGSSPSANRRMLLGAPIQPLPAATRRQREDVAGDVAELSSLHGSGPVGCACVTPRDFVDCRRPGAAFNQAEARTGQRAGDHRIGA